MKIVSVGLDDLRAPHFALVKELRPHLSDDSAQREALNEVYEQGVRFLFCYKNDLPVGFASYRFLANLYLGKHCIVDDLVVLESCRGEGIGTKLIIEVEDLCRKNDVLKIKLDSGLQRMNAHHFYEKNGYSKKCYTFEKDLT